jgi:hypothetical protein
VRHDRMLHRSTSFKMGPHPGAEISGTSSINPTVK